MAVLATLATRTFCGGGPARAARRSRPIAPKTPTCRSECCAGRVLASLLDMSQLIPHHDRPSSGSALSLSASATSESPVALLRYLDVVLVVLGAPILLLIGVSAAGYGIGGGAWVLLRAVGMAVEHRAAVAGMRTQVSLRLSYMLGRLFVLAMVIVLVRKDAGERAGLAALLVIVFAFTIQLGISALNRPRSR
jgi:hypothetical protein